MFCNGLDSSETSKHVLYNGLKHVLQVARQAYSLCYGEIFHNCIFRILRVSKAFCFGQFDMV